ncbi:MAG: HIT family protein [Candidatus Nanoarchaeia archaeon]|nr:HIT family protein [Candidatus Nanoarchaeia archaeon]MDD5588039.1 HIT family protein [Candidatus Nanoarchaeia archaeon]
MVSEDDLSELEQELMGLNEKEQRQKINEFVKTLPKEELAKLQMQQCVFCLLSQGKIKAYKIYENDKFLAVLDINPANIGHVLLFPKKHYQYLSLLSDKDVSEMFMIANNISKVLVQELKAQGVNLYLASGNAAGQKVNHISLNIIPRFENDGIEFAWNMKKASEQDLEQIKTLIASKLAIKKEVVLEVSLEPKKENSNQIKKPQFKIEKRIP